MPTETLYPRYASRAASNSVPVTGDISIGENLGAEYIDLRNVTTIAGPAQDTVIKYWILTAVALEWGTATVTTGGMLTNRVAAGQIIDGVAQETIATLIDVTADDQIYWFNPEKEFDLDAAISAAESSRDATLAVEAAANVIKSNMLALEQDVINASNVADTNAANIQANADTVNGLIAGLGAAFFKNMSASANFVDGVIFNTEAWRDRVRNTSHYQELGKIPKRCAAVIRNDQLAIHDVTKSGCPVWATVDGIGSGSGIIPLSSCALSSVAVSGELIVLGCKAGTVNDGQAGVVLLDFVNDTVTRHMSAISYTGKWIGGGLVNRNIQTAAGGSWDGSVGLIIDAAVNGLAVTTVAGAEIDPATGLPYRTIAIPTDGGVSVINATGTAVDAGKVVHSLTTLSMDTVAFDDDGDLYFGRAGTTGFWHVSDYTVNGFGGVYRVFGDLANCGSIVAEGTTIHFGGSTGSYGGNVFEGVVSVQVDKSNIDNSLIRKATTTYNTGWMRNPVGCWMADSVAGTITPSEHVINGGADSDTDWTKGDGWSVGGGVFACDGTQTAQSLLGQTLTLEQGKQYTVEFTLSNYSAGTVGSDFSGDGVQSVPRNSDGTYTECFTAPVTSTILYMVAASDFVGDIDNISVREAIPDRSVKGNGLAVYGSITSAPVATGADTMAYSGFSASNYLEQPYNPDLDYGTGDFYYEIYAQKSTNDGALFYRGQVPSNTGSMEIYQQSGEWRIRIFGVTAIPTGFFPSDGVWYKVDFLRRSGVFEFWVDDRLIISTTLGASTDLTNVGAVLRIGYDDGTAGAWDDKPISLLHTSASAPTPDQIRKQYNDSKLRFRPNTQSTLGGTSNTVQSLGYDEDTELLYVGKDDGLDVLHGLLRLEHRNAANSNFTDNNIKSISAGGGDLLITTGAEAYFDKEADEL